MGSPRHECVSADCGEEQSIGAIGIENESWNTACCINNGISRFDTSVEAIKAYASMIASRSERAKCILMF